MAIHNVVRMVWSGLVLVCKHIPTDGPPMDEIKIVLRIHPLLLEIVDDKLEIGRETGRLDGAEVTPYNTGGWEGAGMVYI
jgi:hypothetical protein